MTGQRLGTLLLLGALGIAPASQAQGPETEPEIAETISRAHRWTGGARERIQHLQERAERREPLRSLAATFAESKASLAQAASEAGSARVCEAAETLVEAVRKLGESRGSLSRLASQERDRLHRPPALPDEEDTQAALLRISRLEEDHEAVEDAVLQVQAAYRKYQEACEARLEEASFRGRIAAIDDSRRRIWLEDGTELALAETLLPSGILYVGADVQGRHIGFRDSIGVAVDLGPPTKGSAVAAILAKDCLKPAIAPFQSAFSSSQGDVILHPIQGYVALGGKTFQVEKGARIGALATGCPKESELPGPKEFTRRWLEVRFTYRPEGASGDKTIYLAGNLTQFLDQTVALPGDTSAFDTADLSVRAFAQECVGDGTPLPPKCDDPGLVSERTFPLIVRPWGFFCSAHYDQTLFDLPDDEPGAFRTARVKSFTLTSVAVLEAEEAEFTAWGHAVESGALQQIPTFIGLHDPFAISYNFGPSNPKWTSSGVTKEAGLYWPQVFGKRNGGFPFRFSCQLPGTTRDVLSFCPTQPPTLYKLPFGGPLPFRIMGQGNNGNFTHKGFSKYAFDFRLTENAEVLASRAGTVVKVAENQIFNCLMFPKLNPKCFTNEVKIRHEDGSIGIYRNFPYQGVKVEKAEVVARGQLLGWVGNTDKSTTPHVHYQTQHPSADMSIPSRFEAHFPGKSQVLSCLAPVKGDILSSTNHD